MGFPQEILNELGTANPGDIVEAAGHYRLVMQMFTEDDKCVVGGYARMGSDEKLCVADGDTNVIGVIVNDQYFTGCTSGTKIPKGTAVTVLVFGVIAVANTQGSDAQKFDNVFVNDTTGAITFSSSGTATGATDTQWKVFKGAPDNGVVFVVR